MSKKNSTRSKKSEGERRATDPLAFVAIIIAAIPLFFFPNPLALYAQNVLDGFYGIAIWPSSVLAGYAFYRAVEFTKSIEEPLFKDDNKRTFFLVVVMLVLIVGLSFRYSINNPWLSASRDKLMIAIPMFAALRFLDTLFYQGMWQGGVMERRPRVVRVLSVALLALTVHTGFIFAIMPEATVVLAELGGYVGMTVVGATGIALLYEAGWSVVACAIAHAIFGAAFIWYQQLVFI